MLASSGDDTESGDYAKRSGRHVDAPDCQSSFAIIPAWSKEAKSGLARDLVARAGIRVGDIVTEATIKRVLEIASSIDEHFRVGFRRDGKGGLTLTIVNP